MTEIPIPILWWLAPIGSILALVAAFGFYRQLLAASPGDERMREIAGYVREGAFAYLKRQYVVVGLAFLFLAILLAVQSFVLKQQHALVPFAFLTGGFFSGLSGFIGMNTATLASNRTAQGAKESLNRGLQVAFRAGAVMGLVVVGLGLLDISAWFWLLAWLLPRTIEGSHMSLEQITVVMLTFGMGASTQALFARVGGGIFTKAADVGADLVGKVEAGIPEDDPRNPAVIADNVGDNVGDVAGMGADLYESYCGSILATAALGAAAAVGMAGLSGSELAEAQVRLVAAPMILAGLGIVLSIMGIFLVKTEEGAGQLSLLWALRRGIYGTSGFVVLAALFVCWAVLPGEIWLGVFLAITVGLIVGVLIGYFTEYYTAAEFPPTRWITEQSQTGPGTTVIAGIAQGMLSTWAAIAIVGLGTIVAYFVSGGRDYYDVNLMNPKLLVGVFSGVLMVFVFCGLTMKAVGRAAGRMVDEVRRQFRELNLLTDPDAKADYAECVSIATRGAQREMIVPAILAVSAPLFIGMVLDVSGLMGLLAGALTSGFAVAIFMANAGGAWDNAKKAIEAGALGGKGSEAHMAAVVGDTVGDPFKDTSGPSLNILIKLMSMVAVVFAGVIVKYAPIIGEWLGIG